MLSGTSYGLSILNTPKSRASGGGAGLPSSLTSSWKTPTPKMWNCSPIYSDLIAIVLASNSSSSEKAPDFQSYRPVVQLDVQNFDGGRVKDLDFIDAFR